VTNPELAVIEAARQFMAANLRMERAHDQGKVDPYDGTVAGGAMLDALQELRDCLAAHSRTRIRR
jgi:hypothetical protein